MSRRQTSSQHRDKYASPLTDAFLKAHQDFLSGHFAGVLDESANKLPVSSSFIDRDLLLRVIDVGITERAPAPGIQYVAFCDAAGGIVPAGSYFAVAIGHLDGDVVVIDCCRRWTPPFNASEVTGEIASLAKAYGCEEAISDGFSGGFLRAELARHGIGHRISDLNKSQLFLASLPLLTGRRVRMLDLDFVIDEFVALQRRPSKAAYDTIFTRGNDDAANVCAGVIAQLLAVHSEPCPKKQAGKHERECAKIAVEIFNALPSEARSPINRHFKKERMAGRAGRYDQYILAKMQELGLVE